jgi:membrane protease YdiL (CAAX protease family)
MSTEPRANAAAELAPRWHTGALAGLIVAVALVGTLLQQCGSLVGTSPEPAPSASSRIWSQYAPILIVNFCLAAYCCRAFRAHNALPALLGERWHDVRRAGSDLLLALAAVALIQTIEILSAHLFGAGRNAAASAFLPKSVPERFTWLLVAVSVGFCEEVVYRGYLQTQLSAFTGRASLGLCLQAVLFGLAHANQGPLAAARIAIYGLILGALAKRRGSLLPSILAHVGIDLSSAFLP